MFAASSSSGSSAIVTVTVPPSSSASSLAVWTVTVNSRTAAGKLTVSYVPAAVGFGSTRSTKSASAPMSALCSATLIRTGCAEENTDPPAGSVSLSSTVSPSRAVPAKVRPPTRCPAIETSGAASSLVAVTVALSEGDRAAA